MLQALIPCVRMRSRSQVIELGVTIICDQFAKFCLIAGERNCSKSPFCQGSYFFVDFLFSSKIKNDSSAIYLQL